jgi:hypothetical protein
MIFYVASKTDELKKVREIQCKLKSMGHKISYDWTIDAEKGANRTLTKSLLECAINDIEGVKVADAYIGYFVNFHQYKGAYSELGASIALGKKAFIIGNEGNGCVFVNHPLVTKFNTEDEFYKYIKEVVNVC